MLWAVIGIVLVAVLIVKLSGGAIPGITRGDPARREPPRDGGDSSYSAAPMMMTSESGGAPTCDVGDSGWGNSDGDCGGGDGGGGDGGGGD